MIIINGPHVWPNSGTMVPSGSLVSLSLDCVSGYATQRVLELDGDKQPCRYDETGEYNQETCLSFCKRNYVTKYCGCNPSFLFPASTNSIFRIPSKVEFVSMTSTVNCFSRSLSRLHHRGFYLPARLQW